MFDCLKSTGDIRMERRNISPITEVEVHDNINVIFIQDTISFIEVSAGSNLLPLIITKLQNGRLIIENHNTCNWVRDFSIPINVYAHTPKLKKVKSFSSEMIYSLGTLHCDTIEADNRGTGDIELNVIADEVYCKHGIGDNTFTGNADYLYVFNTATGFANCSALSVNRATIINKGSGHSFVNACDILDTEIHYSGNIYYSGNPAIHSTITGSGQLIHQ